MAATEAVTREARRRMPISPGLRIGRILGIPIYVHASWMIIFVLITTQLATQFAQQHPQWTPVQHWAVGVATSLLFFASVLFHELSHSVVARAYKIRVISITLFVFGGVARLGREPAKPIQEFNIAIAGPIGSLVLAVAFYSLTLFFPYAQMVGALAVWLWQTNAILALFNLLPGFPLDGGRVFRAIVWGVTKDFARATNIAGTSGKVVAYVMSHEVPTVPRNMSLEEYGQEVTRTGRRCHLVTTDDRLVGMVNVTTLNSVPRHEWANMSVQGAMIPREKILWARPEESLLGLLERLVAADVNQMPVVSDTENDGAHIIGMITRDSILRVMQARGEVGSLTPTR